MYDFGKPYRQQFLTEDLVTKQHEKQAKYLLLVSVSYVMIHVAIYFSKGLV